MDSLPRQVCSRTAGLPPVLDVDTADVLEQGAPLPLKGAGPGYAAMGSPGYADDTQAVTLGAASLQGRVPATEEWLQVTMQDVRVDKCSSWVFGEQGAPVVLLRGLPIPLALTFRYVGVDIAIGVIGPVVSPRLEAGRSALRRLLYLSTYERRERAISTLVTPLALHGVAVAPVTEPDLRGLGSATVQARWGATRLSRAKEVIFIVLSEGPRVSPVMHTRYERLLRLARVAGRPGVTQVFAQAIWESGGRPPGTGPLGGACSARRPPSAGPCARAGGAGMSQGKNTPWTSCSSLSASSSMWSGTTFAATPRASLRCGARSPSVGWVMGRTVRPVARR